MKKMITMQANIYVRTMCNGIMRTRNQHIEMMIYIRIASAFICCVAIRNKNCIRKYYLWPASNNFSVCSLRPVIWWTNDNSKRMQHLSIIYCMIAIHWYENRCCFSLNSNGLKVQVFALLIIIIIVIIKSFSYSVRLMPETIIYTQFKRNCVVIQIHKKNEWFVIKSISIMLARYT